MTTYNIEVNGVSVIEKISQEKLQENLKIVRGLVWVTGGKDEDITVHLNNSDPPCNI